MWESLSHFYEVDAWLPRNYVFVNADVWNDTSEANQNIVRGCAGMAEYAGAWRAREYTGFTLAGLAAGGMSAFAKIYVEGNDFLVWREEGETKENFEARVKAMKISEH